MKKIFAILIILSICAVGRAATDSNITTLSDPNTSVDCQGKIKQLRDKPIFYKKRLGKLARFKKIKKFISFDYNKLRIVDKKILVIFL